MNISTQISGNIRPNNKSYLALVHMLTQLAIFITHPPSSGSSFKTGSQHGWNRYNKELGFYESIANSSFHIIYNDAEIDDNVGTQILYAILKNRPIVMTGTPILSQHLHPFIGETIVNHFRDFHSINLPELSLSELQELFSKLKATKYILTNSERVLIHAHVKAHFRRLLGN